MEDLSSKFVCNPNGLILYDKHFIPSDKTPKIKLEMEEYGKYLRKPGDLRIRCGLGETGREVLSSEKKVQPIPCRKWNTSIQEIAERITTILVKRSIITTNLHVNYCLYNLYENGKDSIAFHSDSEANSIPVIVSLSLGFPRKFVMLEKATNNTYDLTLGDGSLLILAGETNTNYMHSIPPCPISKKVDQMRINLTFRIVYDMNELALSKNVKNTSRLLLKKCTNGKYTRRYYNDDFWFVSPCEILECNLFDNCFMFKKWGTNSGRYETDNDTIKSRILRIRDNTKQMDYTDWFIINNLVSIEELDSRLDKVSKYIKWKFPHTRFQAPIPVYPYTFFEVYVNTPEIGPPREHFMLDL